MQISESFPLRSIAAHFDIPYEVVLLIADGMIKTPVRVSLAEEFIKTKMTDKGRSLGSASPTGESFSTYWVFHAHKWLTGHVGRLIFPAAPDTPTGQDTHRGEFYAQVLATIGEQVKKHRGNL